MRFVTAALCLCVVAAGEGPCDIFDSAGTPCVAAHAITRALYGAYTGPLYQVQRRSDNATLDVHPLSAGGARPPLCTPTVPPTRPVSCS